MGRLTGKAVIAGVALSDCGVVPDKTPLELMAQATRRALDDAGLSKEDIDGLFTAGIPGLAPLRVGEYLRIMPCYTDSTFTGGCSFESQVWHAAVAISLGLCHTALICYGSTFRSDREMGLDRQTWADPISAIREFETPFGIWLTAAYALAAQRHMHVYGTTSEQLAEIAVATRKWASMNPLATMRTPITIEDVTGSPVISSPLHLLDGCLVSDGGGAVILTSTGRARDLRKKPVQILGCGEYFSHCSLLNMPDLTVTPARESGKQAFEMAGLKPSDIDVLELYDSFTITALLELEDLGFCRKGEGGPLVSGQNTAPGGKLPMNTNGGGLSFIHPGVYGIFLLIEAVQQLRGECGERQVPGAEVALCNGMGGELSASSTVILGRE